MKNENTILKENLTITSDDFLSSKHKQQLTNQSNKTNIYQKKIPTIEYEIFEGIDKDSLKQIQSSLNKKIEYLRYKKKNIDRYEKFTPSKNISVTNISTNSIDNSENLEKYKKNSVRTKSYIIGKRNYNNYDDNKKKTNLLQYLLRNKKNSLKKYCIKLNYKKFSDSFLIINDYKSISKKKIIKNTNNVFLTLLKFFNNSEIARIFCINREIRSCVIGCLAFKVKEKILPNFTLKYCNDFLFTKDYNFMISAKPYFKQKLFIRFILSIKPKINKYNIKIINKRFQISFKEKINKKFIISTYNFDIIEKLKRKKYWVYKENTSFHYDENNKAYYNDLMQFWPGDYILLNLNLISAVGILDFDNFFWLSPKIFEISKQDINICEVEKLVSVWNGIEDLANYELVKKNIENLFGKFFVVKNVFFDDVGYFFFKVILQAYNIGTCNGVDGNIGIKINIMPINTKATNEVKKNGLIFDENNELTVNVGDIVTFYLSQNKIVPDK